MIGAEGSRRRRPDRPELYSYFERVFAGMPDIRVLLDRRILPPGAKPEASSGRGQQERGTSTTSSSSAAS